MSDKILHKRSLTPGSLPTTSSLEVGELAINVADGKIHLRRSGSGNDDILSLVTADTITTGSITATSFSGSFSGSGADLSNIPASAITGLNLSQIATGSIVAAVNVNSASFSVTSGSSTFLFVSSSGRVGIGTTTPTYKLDVSGGDILVNNIRFGKGQASGADNLIIANAGAILSTGASNILIGNSAGSSLTGDSANVVIGRFALNLAGGDYGWNTAIGAEALRSTRGHSHTAIGYSALAGVTSTVYNNVGVGALAGRYQVSGASLSSVSYSVFVGANSKTLGNSENNTIVIGADALGQGSNTVVLGNNNITRTFLKGRVGIGYTPSTTSQALNASLDVAGTTRLSGSFNTAISGSTLTVIGSGSAQPVFTVQGSQGELFSVTDSLSGSLYSINDISGLPILEVFSDNTILMGNYLDPMLITTVYTASVGIGSHTLYRLPTSSYDGFWFEYTVRSGSNARAGQMMGLWSGTSVNYTETTTTDFGSTSDISLMSTISGGNMIITGSTSTAGWTIKGIVRAI